MAELREQALAVGVELDRQAAERLLRFEELLRDRAVPLGAVARSDVDRIRGRHVLDSLRAAPHVRPAGIVYDLGSGAGLPGVPVAIALPDVRVVLVERRSGRAAFLELAVRELGLPNVDVIAGPVAGIAEAAGACLARAFAPLDRAWEAARPLLLPKGRLVYFAGRELMEGASLVAPPEANLEAVVSTPVLESSGPLVIIARQ